MVLCRREPGRSIPASPSRVLSHQAARDEAEPFEIRLGPGLSEWRASRWRPAGCKSPVQHLVRDADTRKGAVTGLDTRPRRRRAAFTAPVIRAWPARRPRRSRSASARPSAPRRPGRTAAPDRQDPEIADHLRAVSDRAARSASTRPRSCTSSRAWPAPSTAPRSAPSCPPAPAAAPARRATRSLTISGDFQALRPAGSVHF